MTNHPNRSAANFRYIAFSTVTGQSLAHADTVAPDRRNRARAARAACAGAWYPVWASGYRANRTLPDRV